MSPVFRWLVAVAVADGLGCNLDLHAQWDGRWIYGGMDMNMGMGASGNNSLLDSTRAKGGKKAHEACMHFGISLLLLRIFYLPQKATA